MNGVTSKLHWVIKFVTPRGKKTLYGDQVAAKQFYLAIVSMKATMKDVQLVEEEKEVLEDVSRISKAKVIEDLIFMNLMIQARISTSSLAQT